MLTDVKANNFFTFGDANATKEGTNNRPDYPGGDNRENSKGCCPNELNPKLTEAVASKQTFVHIEQAHGKGCPDAAYTVHRESTNGIINLDAVDEGHREHHNDS